MGLDCSHDAFSGAYGAFNRFRKAVCEAAGGQYPPHEKDETDDNGAPLNPECWYFETESEWTPEKHPGWAILLRHSDCDGELTPEECKLVADDIELLLPALDEMGLGQGHILRDGGIGAVARRFIAGCRLAHTRNEPLEFA